MKPSLAANWSDELEAHPRTYKVLDTTLTTGAGRTTIQDLYFAVIDHACELEEEIVKLRSALDLHEALAESRYAEPWGV